MGSPPASAPPASASAVRGYRFLRLPLAPGSPVSRTLLVKKHEDRNKSERTADGGRTLFVTHLDNFITEAQLSRCCANAFGPVEHVELKSTEKKAHRAELRADHVKAFVNFARIVFKEKAGLEKAMAAANGRIVGTAVLPPPPPELKEQLRVGKNPYPDPVALRQEIDAWMVKYDERQEEQKRLARESQVDDDGFTKVISGVTKTADGLRILAAKRPTLKTGAFSEPIRGAQDVVATEGGHRKKKKPREQPDFYRFQQREKKREEVAEHRKRKAEAQEKVERMKKAKSFKAAKAAA